MNKKTVAAVVGALVIIGALTSYASPYWTMHEMRSAMIDKDADAFSSHVDFPSVRESLRAQFMSMMQAKLGNSPDMKNNPFAGLGMMMAMGLVNRVIDVMVTPAGVMTMMERGQATPLSGDVAALTNDQGTPSGQSNNTAASSSANGSSGTTSSETPRTDYTVSYKDWSTVTAAATQDGATQVTFIFKRDGLWSWKLSALGFPADMSSSAPAAVSADAPEPLAQQEAPPATPPEQTAPVDANPTPVAAEQLNADYQANEVAADNKYKGHLLSVSGTLQGIKKDFSDESYLEIATNNEFMPIHADLDKQYVAQAASLQKGQPITVICTGNGMVVSAPILKDCAIGPAQTAETIAPPPPQDTQQAAEQAVQPAPAVTQRSESIQASFDCTKAHSTSEMLICGDPDLAALDVELAKLYAQAKAAAPDKQAFAKGTRQNWNWREQNCRDKACLVGWYADQKQRFTDILAQSSQAVAGQVSVATQATPAPGAVPAYSTSFDCSAPTFLDEKAICGDPGLAAMDREMAADYASAMKRTADQAKLESDQSDWHAVRRDCASDLNCLRHSYGVRIDQLRRWQG